MPAFAQQRYETTPVLSASQILPPELLSGPNHRVQERVTNDGYLNIYQIDSKFGTFTAVSTAVLRKRISEINAMVVMEKVQGSKEYIDSIKEGGLDAMNSALSLITSPVKTVSGAVQRSGRGLYLGRRQGLSGAQRSQSEDSKVKDLIGFSTTKRQYAYQFDLDVYSDNEKLQDMLNKISWAGYAGVLSFYMVRGALAWLTRGDLNVGQGWMNRAPSPARRRIGEPASGYLAYLDAIIATCVGDADALDRQVAT